MLGGGEFVDVSGVVVVAPGTVLDGSLVVVGEPAVTITGAMGEAAGGEVVTPDGVMLSFG